VDDDDGDVGVESQKVQLAMSEFASELATLGPRSFWSTEDEKVEYSRRCQASHLKVQAEAREEGMSRG